VKLLMSAAEIRIIKLYVSREAHRLGKVHTMNQQSFNKHIILCLNSIMLCSSHKTQSLRMTMDVVNAHGNRWCENYDRVIDITV
jgi:hypothetical protein